LFEKMESGPSAEGSGADHGDVWLGFHRRVKRIPVSLGVILTGAGFQAEGRILRGAITRSISRTRDPSPPLVQARERRDDAVGVQFRNFEAMGP
jgi:hypothetical protein